MAKVIPARNVMLFFRDRALTAPEIALLYESENDPKPHPRGQCPARGSGQPCAWAQWMSEQAAQRRRRGASDEAPDVSQVL